MRFFDAYCNVLIVIAVLVTFSYLLRGLSTSLYPPPVKPHINHLTYETYPHRLSFRNTMYVLSASGGWLKACSGHNVKLDLDLTLA